MLYQTLCPAGNASFGQYTFERNVISTPVNLQTGEEGIKTGHVNYYLDGGGTISPSRLYSRLYFHFPSSLQPSNNKIK